MEDLTMFYVFGCTNLCWLVSPTFVSAYIRFPCTLTFLFTSFLPRKLLICSINGVLCYFHGVSKGVKGRNVDINKMEARRRVQHFFVHVFEKHYIAIWSCMLVEDIMEVTLLLSQKSINQFVFIWGHEQCSLTLGQIMIGIYYYVKDFKSCVFCLLRIALWQRKPNIVHWGWAKQGS